MRPRWRLQPRPVTAGGVPDRVDEYEALVFVKGEVDVVPGSLQESSTKTGNPRVGICAGGLGRDLQHLQSGRQLVVKQVPRGRAVGLPPAGDLLDLLNGARRELDPLNRPAFARSSAMTCSAGIPRPARKSSWERSRAAWSRARSSSSRSSPWSTGTSSTTVPSGKSTGSSRVSRPAFTVARNAWVMGRRLARAGIGKVFAGRAAANARAGEPEEAL
jgi:hypothetical protein